MDIGFNVTVEIVDAITREKVEDIAWRVCLFKVVFDNLIDVIFLYRTFLLFCNSAVIFHLMIISVHLLLAFIMEKINFL